MTISFQLVIDCAAPERLVAFWSAALGYVAAPPPDGAATWREWYLSVGVPDDELGDGDCADSIVDPDGAGPRIWFQVVPEVKSVKNRLHLDIAASGGRSNSLEERTRRVDVRVAELVALGATVVRVMSEEGLDHYAVAMLDPEGNEFDVN